MITREDMQTILDEFMQVHVDRLKDDIGPNAGDASFFKGLHENITEVQFLEAGERLHKYRNTQLPSLLMNAGLDYTAEDFLEQLGEQGVVAHEYATKHKKLSFLAWKHARDNGVWSEFADAHKDLAEELFGHTFAPKAKENGLEDIFQLYLDARKQHLEEAERRENAVRMARTVRCEVYEDVWYSKNDRHQRYPKKSNRILMRFPYDEALIPALKKAVVGQGRCIWKPAQRAWSLKMEKDLIDKASAVFTEHGYYPEQLLALKSQCATPKPADSTISAEIVGQSLRLKWGWIQDDDLRGRVMAIVKGIMGRKWDASSKSWSVPVAQAVFLKGKLDGVYQPLADAIGALPSLADVMSKTAERIAISSASTLSNEEVVADMRERLSKVFPEGRELYPFQYAGVRFAELANGKALIGDDMGVGKTIQALAYTALHPEHHPVLVVCPANVKYNWLKESQAWLTTYESAVVNKGNEEIPDADVVVINYDLMSKQESRLLARGFNTVIFDESHYLKNYKAKRTQASLTVAEQAKSVLALSGTAITNRPNEFFTTLNLLRPNEFNNFFTFAKRYCDAYHNGWGWDFSGSSNEAELHERTRSVAIRRLKKEVMAELPDKIRQIVDVHPTPKEMKSYRDMATMWAQEYDMHLRNNSLPKGFVLNMLTELRHHAGRMKAGATARWAMDYHTTTGKPLIIFTHHRDVQEMVTEQLSLVHEKMTKDERSAFGSLTLGYINGSTSAQKRQEAVESFQAGNIKFLICSTVAAKEGLTLTKADTVLFVEREWVPGWEEQAEDRVNRIGQDAETVHAVYLTVAKTIDERFNAVVEAKRATVSAILDGGEVGKRDGIAKALLKAMVDAGEMPASMLKNMGVNA